MLLFYLNIAKLFLFICGIACIIRLQMLLDYKSKKVKKNSNKNCVCCSGLYVCYRINAVFVKLRKNLIVSAIVDIIKKQDIVMRNILNKKHVFWEATPHWVESFVDLVGLAVDLARTDVTSPQGTLAVGPVRREATGAAVVRTHTVLCPVADDTWAPGTIQSHLDVLAYSD